MRHRAPGKVHFEWARPQEPFVVPASSTLINWVLENLLKNALDALEGSGKIQVEMARRQQQIIVDITDTGKGIPPALIGRVFEPGYTTKKRGWGLGLTLSRRIVEQYHRGQLYVKNSEPGVGTTFRMVLPANT
jgi:signal transduction histidine kinase